MIWKSFWCYVLKELCTTKLGKVDHPALSVLATAPTGGSGDKVWSDRKEVKEGGNITAINIKKSSFGIARIRTR